MLSKIRTRTESESGFTLIELLVVMLIVGILAAIAVPSFISQRSKSYGAVAKADVRSAQEAMEAYFVDNDTYVGADAAALIAIEPTLTNANLLASSGLSADAYTVTVTAKDAAPSTTFSINRITTTGAITRTCSAAGKAGCKTGGVW